MKFLLDTDICIFFLQGKYDLKSKIDEAGLENCCVSEITIAELKYGAENSENVERHSREVSQIENLFTTVPIYSSLNRFAKEKVVLKRRGELLPDFDILIASTALANDLILVSNNEKHMKRFADLSLENWSQPSHPKT